MGDLTSEDTRASVEQKVRSFVQGDLEHAAETLVGLWEIASNDEDITSPANSSFVVSSFQLYPPAFTLRWSFCRQAKQATAPPDGALVRRALIKSIRNGVFLDRKYWARHSKAAKTLKPIYFSSTIMNDRAQQLGKRRSGLLCCHLMILRVASGKIP